MKIHGGIAQSVEHTAHIRDVYGSIPYSAKTRASRVFFFALFSIQNPQTKLTSMRNWEFAPSQGSPILPPAPPDMAGFFRLRAKGNFRFETARKTTKRLSAKGARCVPLRFFPKAEDTKPCGIPGVRMEARKRFLSSAKFFRTSLWISRQAPRSVRAKSSRRARRNPARAVHRKEVLPSVREKFRSCQA